ncbi:hypothetical protein OMCYN_00376 [cyanobiont of Ornithocercus magnificus]|nr:hypothetical protein OMCYN_00376 [cyanobiont of Ornithocercus magnificus]
MYTSIFCVAHMTHHNISLGVLTLLVFTCLLGELLAGQNTIPVGIASATIERCFCGLLGLTCFSASLL